MTTTETAQAADQAVRTALSARARPPRASALAASLTFAWRALLKLRHVPEQLIDIHPPHTTAETTRRNVMSQPTQTTRSHHAGSAELFSLEGRNAEGGKETT